MPELPEVETIKNQLIKYLPLEVLAVKYSKVSSSILKTKEFSPKGKTIKSISRKGKLLNFHLSEKQNILSHLGMSGSWRISKIKIQEKHTHILLECLNKKKEKIFLGYVDPRRFGNMYFLKEANTHSHLNRLRVDISTKEFNEKYLYEVFQKFPNKLLKPFLLDQKYFAGCGNYIANEICALAKILPTRLCKNISKNDCKNILKATKSVIEGSIKNNGLTFAGGYVDAFGEKGMGVLNLVVFNQKICGICNNNTITKIELGKRGTYFCKVCQF